HKLLHSRTEQPMVDERSLSLTLTEGHVSSAERAANHRLPLRKRPSPGGPLRLVAEQVGGGSGGDGTPRPVIEPIQISTGDDAVTVGIGDGDSPHLQDGQNTLGATLGATFRPARLDAFAVMLARERAVDRPGS